ncbi:hypothetical protein [Hymenobacter elongatus]|uniref:SH3 domain-containing protein n=1 Tax=Hymenobacter elongatus TaxID=877208 RepID=A0A4Z0PQN3_9BACT|nr:hypothetical protein [Hymenobacter elongatus]TGE18362.1 hypothetical protein E5J99_05530 [Hymenobacter elongatus]
MSNQLPPKVSLFLPVSAGARRRTLPHLVLLGTAVLWLSACSDEKSRQNSELRVRQPAASEASAPAADETAGVAAPEVASGAAGAGSRYRVVVETAYFFDAPQAAKPNGRYLLRGDVLHGEEERSGFVKTRFVNPAGQTVVGWLRAGELSKTAGAVAGSRRPSPAVRPPSGPVAPEADYRPAAEPASELPASKAAPGARGSGLAVVQVAKSYFYSSADLTQPRRAHCVRGDKVRVGEASGDAVYVTFTNWENVTTTGWMRQDALRSGR